MSAWRVEKEEIFQILNIWLNTKFEDKNGTRAKRLDEMDRWT
jgi:ribose 5-phosphate isomerase RpiB